MVMGFILSHFTKLAIDEGKMRTSTIIFTASAKVYKECSNVPTINIRKSAH